MHSWFYVYIFAILLNLNLYEVPSKSSVMNGSLCVRREYASLILCIHIWHSIIHPHKKFRSNQANINIVIGIQSGISHIHWPLFEDEKEERVEIGGVNFHTKMHLKGNVEQTYEYNTYCIPFECRIQDLKVPYLRYQRFSLERRLRSCITRYRLLMWI